MINPQWAEKDFYAVLGVGKDASAAEIKKRYRVLAKELHPDTNKGDAKDEERFKAVSEAYDVLADAATRKEYDEARALFSSGGGRAGGFGGGRQGVDLNDLINQMRGGGGAPGSGGGGFGDILGGLFGGGRRATAQPRRGADLETEATLKFGDALAGVTLPLRLSGEAPCAVCSGTGAKAGTTPRLCPTCQGAGQTSRNAGGFAFPEPCRECRGRGMVVDDPCLTCLGSGRGQSSRTIHARIPAGVRDGQKIRLKGKGGPGERGGPNGDLYVRVHVEPHPVFGRKGEHVTIAVPITYPEAALGAQVTVPTPAGSTVTVKIPPGTASGRTFRVRGKGAPKGPAGGHPGGHGDLLVTVEVAVPHRLSKAAHEALEAYREATAGDDPRADLQARAKGV
jgi:molecular chaperone DnaJ